MQWQEACENQSLKNLPFKIELDNQGKVLMTPVKVNHSILQGKIIGHLYQHITGGEALAECAIKTKQGTKVADVAWASYSLLEKIENEVECSVAPEICIEVLSFSNTKPAINEKKIIYFEQGAAEFWLCDSFGNISFFVKEGKIEHSKIAKNFPTSI
jgi:Uma2 family endonuclease